MKLSTQVLASLVATLATFGRSAIVDYAYANPSSYTKCKNTVENINKYCFQRGDRGTYITSISNLLKELGYYQGKPTNDFNLTVKKSVVKFQKEYRLEVANGIVENNTLLKMCQAARKGCSPNAGSGCYMGSPRLVVACLNKFKDEKEQDRSYSN
jgi:peptidoglycan hydrolase-like protein with peptidoglycan-binding domain